MVSVFFSYSHRDESLRDELEIHLASLKRQGLIDTWHDRQIAVGEEFDLAISEHLEKADIILLLVSPDFIASDYCYSIEMTRALERHNNGEARVIPVILRPCDWQSLDFGKLLATPTDGKPVTKFPNRDEAFLEITTAIKKAVQQVSSKSGQSVRQVSTHVRSSSEGYVIPEIRSSNLRIKKEFTDLERDRFLEESFEFIANYFEGSLRELKRRNPGLETNFRRIDSNTFSAAIYRNGSKVASCRVRLGKMWQDGGIMYSATDSESDTSYSEMLIVTDDGYTLSLALQIGMWRLPQGKRTDLTQEGGAEHLWSLLLEPLQR